MAHKPYHIARIEEAKRQLKELAELGFKHPNRDARYTVPQSSVLWQQSIATTNKQIADEVVKVIRLGGCVFISGSEILRMNNEKTAPKGRKTRRGQAAIEARREAGGAA